MLTILRKGATSWVAQIFIMTLSLSFAFVGIQGIFRFAGDKPIAVIGNERIESQAYGIEFKRDIERMRKSFGAGFDAAQAKQIGLDRQVLERMINTNMFEQRARDIGLAVGDAAVVNRIQTEPVFQGVGGFDRLQFEVILRNNNLNEAMYVNLLRSEMLRQQLVDTFRNQPPAPIAMTEPLFRRVREERIGQFFIVGDKALGTLPAPSPEQIESYYRANEARFSAPEYRRLSYLDLTAKDMTAQVQVSEEDLASAFETHKDEFSAPARREIDQFVVSDKAKAAEVSAKLAAGADFATIAQEAAGIKPSELSLGSVTAADLPAEVAIAAFDAPVGKVIGPIDTAFGATFLRTTKEVPASNKTFEQVKPELAAKVSLEKATDILYEVVRKIEDRRSGGESISVIAKDLNLKLSTTELLDAQGNDRNNKPVANLPQDPKFLTDGFALEADRETDLVELATGRFMLVRVEEIVPQALKPLAQVKPEVIAAWSADERAAKLKALATSLVDKAKQGDFARVAAEVKAIAKMSNPLQRNRPDPEMGSEVPNALFAAQPGGIVSGLAPAGTGYVVARLERVVPVDLVREAAGLKSARNDLANSISGDLLEQYQVMLRVKYDVTINEQSLARAVGVANPSGGN